VQFFVSITHEVYPYDILVTSIVLCGIQNAFSNPRSMGGLFDGEVLGRKKCDEMCAKPQNSTSVRIIFIKVTFM
jgi:hypothetical protein